jgi:hypothetical protein
MDVQDAAETEKSKSRPPLPERSGRAETARKHGRNATKAFRKGSANAGEAGAADGAGILARTSARLRKRRRVPPRRLSLTGFQESAYS